MILNTLTKRMASLALKPPTRELSSLISGTGRLSRVALPLGPQQSLLKQLTSLTTTMSPQKFMSTQGTAAAAAAAATKKAPPQVFAKNRIVTDGAGRRYAVDDLLKPATQKLKPRIVKARLSQMKTYEGRERAIRGSPWRLQLVCRHVTGLPMPEAIKQLTFLTKRMAPLVKKVLIRTCNLADIRDGLQPSQIEIAECFATQGSHLKRMRFHGRGRMGIMHHKFAHMRVVLREIDFPLRIYLAKTPGEKKRWVNLYLQAQEDYNKNKVERDELESLERLAALNEKGKEGNKQLL